MYILSVEIIMSLIYKDICTCMYSPRKSKKYFDQLKLIFRYTSRLSRRYRLDIETRPINF